MKCTCRTCQRKRLKKEDPIRYWAARWLATNRTKTKKNKIDKNVDADYLIEQYNEGKKKYPLMDLDNGLWSVSVDRIDSSSHYRRGNIQIIPIWLNNAKSSSSMSEINNAIKLYYKEVIS